MPKHVITYKTNNILSGL